MQTQHRNRCFTRALRAKHKISCWVDAFAKHTPLRKRELIVSPARKRIDCNFRAYCLDETHTQQFSIHRLILFILIDAKILENTVNSCVCNMQLKYAFCRDDMLIWVRKSDFTAEVCLCLMFVLMWLHTQNRFLFYNNTTMQNAVFLLQMLMNRRFVSTKTQKANFRYKAIPHISWFYAIS